MEKGVALDRGDGLLGRCLPTIGGFFEALPVDHSSIFIGAVDTEALLILMVVPPILLLLVGLSVVWARRGFVKE